MRPLFDRDRFASDLDTALKRRKLSYRQAVAESDMLNPAMISRAMNREKLAVESFLALCMAFDLKPLDYIFLPEKQAVTAVVQRETAGVR